MTIAASPPPLTVFPIHRIQEARDRWYQVREGLQKLESCLEQRIAVPPGHTFGGMMGDEWAPRLAELPDRLSLKLTSRVLPAIETCCQRNPETRRKHMTNEPHQAFTAAQAFREAIPLPSGRYKIEEALWELRRLRATVEGVARILRKDDPEAAKAALPICASEERGTQLKRFPRHVADILGRKILPGIAELHADGVPKAEVRNRTKAAKAKAATILRDCADVTALLRGGIKIEYDALRAGRSHLLPLIDAAETVVEDALSLIGGG
jgi:hypothetical protein